MNSILMMTKNTGVIIGPVASFLGWVMDAIFRMLNSLGMPNIGLAIIILTVLIYLCLLPLTIKQQKFAKLQRKMQPEISKIQKKYAGKKDQVSLTRQQEEMKAVYAKYGVSTMGSCAQLIVQMPILLAMYRVFYNVPAYVSMVKEAFFPLVDNLIAAEGSAEYLQGLSAASMFSKQFTNESFTSGVTEYVQNTYIDVLNKFSTADWTALGEKFSSLSGDIASTTSKLSTYNNFLGLNMSNAPRYVFSEGISSGKYILCVVALIIPILAAFTQWLNVKLMPQAANSDPNDQMAATMKSMNIMMPLMSAFFCFSLPSGMGLYWIVGAVVRSIQQFFINRHIDKMDIDAMIARNMEKIKEKEAKEAKSGKSKNVSSSSVNEMSTMNTRSISSRSNTQVSASAEQAQNRRGKKYKSGSLSAKANLVDEFNDAGRK